MTDALNCALRLLTRRDHGFQELLQKLKGKGYSNQDSLEAVNQCRRLGYQDDERYAESLCRERIRQGYGPIRITQELQSKGVDACLILAVLKEHDLSWEENALAVWQKKYKTLPRESLTNIELQKQQRFLFYRGFSAEIVRKIVYLT